MKSIFCPLAATFLALFFLPKTHFSQTPTQTVVGLVLDKDTRQPLIGATVSVQNSSPALGAMTDADGKFKIANVSVGRWQFQCSYLGYESFLSDPAIVNSARENFLQIELVEQAVRAKEVVITAKKRGNEPLNEASILSARSFSVDETQRYASSANDPGRMAQGMPGVQPSRDNRSDIVVRGNSGIGLLWRLEGIDIPNPNHFARRGSSGGGITVFSVSMLGNSDFSTGAFPAEYGNAYGGVFDIKFRKGNPQKRGYTFRAGMLGLDASTEGPFKKGGDATYLINYRYSTLGILNKLGLHLVGPRVDNNFQDLSFNLHLPTAGKKQFFTLWGIGGLSAEVVNPEKDTADWKSYDDYFTRDFTTRMGALGMTHTVLLGERAFVKTSVAAMGQSIDYQNDTVDRNEARFVVNDEKYREGRYAVASFLSKKFNSKLGLKTGFFLNLMPYSFARTTLGDSSSLNAKGTTQQFQPYAQLRFRPTEKITLNLGFHALFFALNNTRSLEPRIGLKFQLTEKQSLSLAAGLHGRVLPLGNYFTSIGGKTVNLDLKMVRAWHLVAGYDVLPGEKWRVHAEIYFQKFDKVPVAKNAASTWSILNTIDGFAKQELVNEGGGSNTGLDLSLEKSFDRGTFFILSASVSSSKYTAKSGKEFPTAFDSGLSATFMGGKEWEFDNAAVLQISLKVLYNGGQRLTPLAPGQSVSRYSPDPALDESRPFSEKVDAYFRPDARIAYRKNNPRSAWTLALDVQNIMARRNIDPLNRTYDPDKNVWVFREQSGVTPVLSFQIDL